MDLDVEPLNDSARAGHRWTNAAAGAGALMISVVSLWVAITNGHTNKQLVAATSWPFLQIASGNADDQGNQVINMELKNAGVGPAKVETFEVFWEDKPVKNSSELLIACCSYHFPTGAPDLQHPSLVLGTNQVAGNVIRAGDSIKMLSLPLRQDAAVVWHRLDIARFKMRFRTCYCSVFDECWVSDLASLAPKPVQACKVPTIAYSE